MNNTASSKRKLATTKCARYGSRKPYMETEQTLGYKTFRFSLIRNSLGGVLLLLLSIVLLLGRGFIARSLPLDAGSAGAETSVHILNIFTNGLFILSILILLGTVVATWIMYVNTTFVLAEYALKIRTGFINKREILIPYRQIQDVDINRSLFHRILGVSNLVILTAGHEDDAPSANTDDDSNKESEGLFDLLDADLAEKLQAELVKRASVQMVSEVGPHPQAPLSASGI